MLKICITNFSVQLIQTLGSINMGKTIISQNQASQAILPPPPPSAASFPQGQAVVPTPGQVAVPTAEVIPGAIGQVPISPAVVRN